MKWLSSPPGWLRVLRRGVDDLELLLEGRLLLFLIGDFLALVWGIFSALLAGGKIDKVYALAVLLPTLPMLGSALSSVIALERRAGSLDLALAAPSPARFFLRRMWPPLVLAWLQGNLVLLVAFFEAHRLEEILALQLRFSGTLLRASISWVLVLLTVGAINLFWATRLRSGGGVFVANLLSFLALSPFFFHPPMLGPKRQHPVDFFDVYNAELVWLWPQVVLLLTALLFFFAGLARLRRPEVLS